MFRSLCTAQPAEIRGRDSAGASAADEVDRLAVPGKVLRVDSPVPGLGEVGVEHDEPALANAQPVHVAADLN